MHPKEWWRGRTVRECFDKVGLKRNCYYLSFPDLINFIQIKTCHSDDSTSAHKEPLWSVMHENYITPLVSLGRGHNGIFLQQLIFYNHFQFSSN